MRQQKKKKKESEKNKNKKIEVDFTEVNPCRGYRYLLMMVCTFMGWVETYPTKTEKANEVA